MRPFSHARAKTEIAKVLLHILLSPRLLFPSISELCRMLRREITLDDLGKDLCVQLQAVIMSLNSPDALIRLFEAFQSLLAADANNGSTSFVHPASPLGLFLRRCIASFKLLPFESVVDLFTELLESRKCFESEANILEKPQEEKRAPWKPGPLLDSNLALLIDEQDTLGLDGVLREQVSALLLLGHNGATDIPPNATLLQLSESIRSKNYGLAVDLLHKHHDLERPSDESLAHQRSLLSLSHLHRSFGHNRMSLDALHESIRMAQQTGDSQCLGECLLNLSQIMMGSQGLFNPGLPELGLGTQPSHNHWQMLHLLLSRCLSKGQELKRPDIASFARLGLSQVLLMTGGGMGASEGSESIGGPRQGLTLHPCLAHILSTARDVTLMSHVAWMENVSGAPQPPLDTNAPVTPSLSGTYASIDLLPLPDAARSVHICQQLDKAAGCAQLLKAHGLLSYGCPLLAFTEAVSSMASAKAEDRGQQHALLLKSIEQRMGLEAAVKAVSLLPTTTSGSKSQTLKMTKLSMQIKQFVVDDDLSSAWAVCDEMTALLHPSQCPLPSLEVDVLKHSALVSLASTNYSEARDMASRMFALSSYHGLEAEAEEALLLLSEIFIASSCDELATPCLRSLLQHSRVSRHDGIHKQAAVPVSKVTLI